MANYGNNVEFISIYYASQHTHTHTDTIYAATPNPAHVSIIAVDTARSG